MRLRLLHLSRLKFTHLDVKSLKDKSSKRSRILRYFVAAVVFVGLFFVGKYTIPRFPFGPYFLYSDLTPSEKIDRIPYDTLTTEVSHPFVHSDKNYPFSSQGRIRAKENRDAAIEKFPDALSCLTKTGRKQPDVDLRLLNWDAFQSLQDVNICFWRVFSSLETPERVEKWIKFHNAMSVYTYNRNQGGYTTDYVVGHHLVASWSVRGDNSLPYPSKGIRLFEDGGWSSTVWFTCLWNDSGKLISVSARWGAVL